jgi:hypothetical protein
MISSIIQWAIISLILIILIHYLYRFFKNTLTVPKIKDLVNKPIDEYKEIYDTIRQNNSNNQKTNNLNKQTNGDTNQNKTMKDELKNYLTNLNSVSGNDNSIGENNQDNSSGFSSYDFQSNNFSSY